MMLKTELVIRAKPKLRVGLRIIEHGTNLLSLLLLPLNMSPKRTSVTKQRPMKRTRPCSFSLSVHLPLMLIA